MNRRRGGISHPIRSDPIGLAGGVNVWGYVEQNLLSLSDSDGLCPWCAGAAAGAAFDFAWQMYDNGGNLECVDWGEVSASAALGATGGGSLGKLGKYLSKGKKPFVPDGAWTRNTPKQVTPGTKTIEHTKFNQKTGEWEKSTVRYDRYGRQTGRTDYTTHGRPDAHTNPHYHTTEYGPGYAPGGKESGVLPGPLP